MTEVYNFHDVLLNAPCVRQRQPVALKEQAFYPGMTWGTSEPGRSRHISTTNISAEYARSIRKAYLSRQKCGMGARSRICISGNGHYLVLKLLRHRGKNGGHLVARRVRVSGAQPTNKQREMDAYLEAFVV